MVDVADYRMTTHWTLKVGDLVKCKPLSGNKFMAEVTKIRTNDDTGDLIEIEVVGGKGKTRSVRTFRPERISKP